MVRSVGPTWPGSQLLDAHDGARRGPQLGPQQMPEVAAPARQERLLQGPPPAPAHGLAALQPHAPPHGAAGQGPAAPLCEL